MMGDHFMVPIKSLFDFAETFRVYKGILIHPNIPNFFSIWCQLRELGAKEDEVKQTNHQDKHNMSGNFMAPITNTNVNNDLKIIRNKSKTMMK